MAFPPAHVLVGAGVAEVVRSGTAAPLPRWRAWAFSAALAVLPDLDIVLGIALGRGGLYHGTFTHSIPAIVVTGLLCRAVLGPPWGVLAAAGYGSHLVVDLLDDRGRTNVLLGWPFTDERPFAIARIFPKVEFQTEGGLRDSMLSLFEPRAVAMLLAQTAVAAGFFVGLLLVADAMRRVGERVRRSP